MSLELQTTATTIGGPAPDDAPDRDGADEPEIAGYRIVRRLGVGGTSVVYEARAADGRAVALKVIRPGRSAAEPVQRRLLREARALGSLSHPNVVRLLATGEHDGQLYIAMEYVAGASLEAWLAAARGWREVVEMFVQVGRGLAAAHAAGLVHRDVKPANVMVGDDGRGRVVDFGLVRALAGASDLSAASVPAHASVFDASLTKTGAVIGTPAYMAPEQIEGRRCGGRSDQFSYCVALYAAVYGRRPFAGELWHELVGNVLAGAVVAPPDDVAPAWLFAALRRGLAVQPRERWDSMDALVDALERGLAGRPEPRDPAARRRLVVVVLAVVLAAALVVALAVMA